jgi:hypothetical protein
LGLAPDSALDKRDEQRAGILVGAQVAAQAVLAEERAGRAALILGQEAADIVVAPNLVAGVDGRAARRALNLEAAVALEN